MLQRVKSLVSLCFMVLMIQPNAHAVLIGGVDFPDGQISFADSVVSFLAGGDASDLLPRTQNSNNALGSPDYDATNTCDVNNTKQCDYVTLGDGGEIVLQFLDNVLTGSGDANFDLWIFEVGPDVEDTFVEVSDDGMNWTSVGKVAGATAGIDIDAFGFSTQSALRFVKLIDDPNEGQQSGQGPFVGADIDAVGAISTRFVPPTGMNEPSVALLLCFALLLSIRRQTHRTG